VFWLEFAAYSIAMAESVWLIIKIIRAAQASVSQNEPKRWRGIIKRELKLLAISIAACAGLLTIGAIVEVFIISLAG
jgi:hypothetical protein